MHRFWGKWVTGSLHAHRPRLSLLSSVATRRLSRSHRWDKGGRSTKYRSTKLLFGACVIIYSWHEASRHRTAALLPKAQSRHAIDSPIQHIPYEEVQNHASADDCWIILKGLVYDLTEFLDAHPGGRQAILSAAGTDATTLFDQLHPSDALDSLPPQYCLGMVDPSTLPKETSEMNTEDIERIEYRNQMPHVDDFLLLEDFELWASRVLSTMAWAYYRSAADEERTYHENKNAFQRYFFRPRVLRGQSDAHLGTDVVGVPCALPIFMCPTAMAKLGHPLGEVNFTRAAARHGIVQMISANASCSVEEIFGARAEGQPVMYQIYLNKDRSASARLLEKVERLGAKSIVFTVDVAWDSKRTLDVRHKACASLRRPQRLQQKPAGVSQSIGSYQDRDLSWKDISFIRQHTSLPIIVKGVQCVEDIQLCVDHGVEGVVLSNHGGRQADYAPAPIDILHEARTIRPDLFDKIDIMIDGGIRCGADVVKALALGAKAVGIGRSFLYANGLHGEEGVSRVIEIIQEEMVNTMRNIGASRLEDLGPELVRPTRQ